MRVEFLKMHGCGNDYIYLDGFRAKLPEDAPALARRLSDRHFSIGSDGLVYVLPGAKAPARMRMWNADGSEAEMCGNAIRCVAKLIYERGHVRQRTIPIETGNGVLDVRLDLDGERVTRAYVAMGTPTVGPPVELTVDGRTFRGRDVSVGNPHFVILGAALDDATVLGFGPKLEKHPHFPKRANIEFVQVEHEERENILRTRVWERGSGETLACGTGACAVHAAAQRENHTNDRSIVVLPGGTLGVEWRDGKGTIYLDGPCELAFEGSVEV